jgi:hypothetical protein
VDKQRYNTADRVTVFARLYDQNFDPVKQPSVNGLYTVQGAPGQAEGPKQSVQLRALPDQPGMYRGDFVAVTPGGYKFSVESDTATTIDFAVVAPRFETGETAMNEPLLKEMSRVSGGAFFREEDLATLPEKLSEKDERITRVVDAELWASPFYFLLVAGIVIAEWALRKSYGLKRTPRFPRLPPTSGAFTGESLPSGESARWSEPPRASRLRSEFSSVSLRSKWFSIGLPTFPGRRGLSSSRVLLPARASCSGAMPSGRSGSACTMTRSP